MKTSSSNSASRITLKALLIGAMILVLLIPVAMMKQMIKERMQYQQEVEAEIGSTWGGPQTVAGPVLVLPYSRLVSEGKQVKVERCNAYFLPEALRVDGAVETEVRSRTAHKVLLYRSDLAFSGRFARPDIASLGLKPESIRWDEATLYVGVSSLQGLQSSLAVEWDGERYANAASVRNDELTGSGLAVPVPLAAADSVEIPFDFRLKLNGTGRLFFVPVGKETEVHLASPWETVSFAGNYLPAERELTAGFDAEWKIFDFNRSFPQAWLDGAYAFENNKYDPETDNYLNGSALTRTAFGADLRFPLDHYQLSMRAVKYAVMFIALTFFIFFLVELLSRRRIHPIQYLLVSCGLVLFYSLLLALSEHIGFGWAYLASAAGIVALVTAYSASIFRSWKQTVRMGLFLVALYVYLYVMLQLEDMALLFGSLGLFVALAIIMYVSRRIDWYKGGEPEPEKPAEK